MGVIGAVGTQERHGRTAFRAGAPRFSEAKLDVIAGRLPEHVPHVIAKDGRIGEPGPVAVGAVWVDVGHDMEGEAFE